MRGMSNSVTAQSGARSREMNYRAEVDGEGNVSLVADTAVFSVTIVGEAPRAVIQLSAERFTKLHELSAASDKVLFYDHSNGRFLARRR